MATLTKGTTFASGDVVTPAKLNNLVDAATVTLADNEVTTAKIADGAVTQAKLNASVTLVPTGAVMPFAMNSAPSGWLAANGAAVSRTTYAGLFSAIGTTYGTGDGSTTFNLPDLRGYFVRGSGTNSDGTASGTFGAKQTDAVIAHTHSGTTGNDSPDHTHAITFSNVMGGPQLGGTGLGAGYPSTTISTPTNVSIAAGTASARHQHTFTTSSQSPAGATETRPKNIALLYCIKA